MTSPVEPMELRTAYGRIYDWFRRNVSSLEEQEESDYKTSSLNLVQHLPPPDQATDLEMRAVLAEVVGGLFECGYSGSDGHHKMFEYAHAATSHYPSKYSLRPEDIEDLRSSHLWPYLSPARNERQNAEDPVLLSRRGQ